MRLTFLKPDYYEFFPTLGTEEILYRLKSLPFHLATLLSVKNILSVASLPTVRPVVCSYFRSRVDDRLRMLEEVMQYSRIRQDIVSAMRGVRKEIFVSDKFQPFCYLNHYVPFSKNSCLSAPGLVALMIECLRVQPTQRILEIGIGSGYHAAWISKYLCNSCQIIGVEINPHYATFGRSALLSCGYQNIEILSDGEALGGQGNFARIYITAATRIAPPENLISYLESGGLIQYIRGITAEEFHSEYPESWLRRTFPSYEAYDRGDWRSYCCLVTAQKIGEQLKDLNRLYDVRFVPLQGNNPDYQGDFEESFRPLYEFL